MQNPLNFKESRSGKALNPPFLHNRRKNDFQKDSILLLLPKN